MLQITGCTIEDLTEGCVTDKQHPVISFQIRSDRENVMLDHAVIRVGKWETETKEQIEIPYDGEPLQPMTVYPVTVTAVDDRGERATAETSFQTGLLGSDWKGSWISDPAYRFRGKKTSPIPMQFRKTFSCRRKVKSAQLLATAIGIYEVRLNGQKVGTDYFAPGLTSYSHTLQYQVYDITLQETNTLDVVVGGGWAVGAFTFSRKNRITAPRQAFLAQLMITYEDGQTEIIGTDASWLVSEAGKFRYGDFYDGEVYDASVEEASIVWKQAAREKLSIQPALLATYGSLVHAQQRMVPVSCRRSGSGELIYDFGQNFAGVIHAVIRGKKGQRYCFRHAELLMDGELYTEPLRSAKTRAVYTCRDGEQTYSPCLTYMGFRYVGITMLEADDTPAQVHPEDLELTALVLHSDLTETGSFSCSNELINRLQENIRWSTRSNFMDIPTDCPQRDERMGWTGDIALFAPTAAYNFDTRRFLKKWLLDMKAEQRKGGGINVVIPEQGFRYPFAVVAYWGDACILVPWALYQAYGDEKLLEEMYPVMCRYMEAVKFWAGFACVGHTHRHTWRWWHQYGDWVAPDTRMWGCMNRGLWTATACWSHSCDLMAQIAGLLHREEDREYYTQLKQDIDRAYAKRFLEEDGRMKKLSDPFARSAQKNGTEFQSGYVLPLAFRMLEGQKKEGALKALLQLVKKADYHIGTGFPGTPFILFTLADNGRVEEAYRMLLQEECPSWLYEVKAGGTTIWERWDALRSDGTCNTGNEDGTGGMTSFNHYASGAVGAFLYSRIAGIEALQPGYRHFRIRPVPGGGLTAAKGTLESPYGRIVSDWQMDGRQFRIHIEVPACTTCTLELPDGSRREYGSGSYDAEMELSGL